jgi:alpha-beta hydrolase superfamily lysophospholipase
MELATPLELADWPTGTGLRGYRLVPADPVAVVLVVHGFGEYAGRHAKTMQRLAQHRIASYAYDQRGHGHSPGKRAIVERFDDLVDDALTLRKRAAAENPGLPVFLFGVSMGGVVATRSAERDPSGLRGVVLLAPAFAAAENIPKSVQSLLRGLRKIAPGLPLARLTFSQLSRDPSVGEAYRLDPLTYHGGVPLCTGTEIVAAGEAAVADAGSFAVPTLLLQGDADTIVFPIGAKRFADAARNAELTYTVVPGGYHELFNDPGGDELTETMAGWILAHAS